ncbi:MAG: ATP-binding protein [Candidatus Anstonellales archaeon]
MKEIIKRLIVEFWESKPAFIQRHKIPSELITGNHCLVLTGPRRAGKSFLVYEIREQLSDKNIVYINFEDDRLDGFRKEHFDLILDAYYELKQETPVIFLDEVHIINGWESFARRLADTGYKTIITGSNSKLLSREISERLGARFIEVPVFPLDFNEFLRFKGFSIKQDTEFSKDRFLLKRFLEEYLLFGGFPEVAKLTQPEAKYSVLATYFDLVFFKDLIGRRKLENESILRFIIKKARENVGNTFTPRSVYRGAKEAGIDVGPNTVEKYLEYLEEAFLLIPSYPFSKSVLRQERKKRFFVDNGYLKLFEIKEDRGLMLENLIFMELIKKGKKVCYHYGKRECDFIVDGKQAVQVAYEFSEENERREIEGLLEAMNAYNLKEGSIITFDQEKEMNIQGNIIHVIPAWKWLVRISNPSQ